MFCQVSDSFDPYDPLVGLATSEEGPKEGFGGGLFGAPPGGSDIGQQGGCGVDVVDTVLGCCM